MIMMIKIFADKAQKIITDHTYHKNLRSALNASGVKGLLGTQIVMMIKIFTDKS